MLIYTLTAALFFSLVASIFMQDEAAPKDDFMAWLFIVFAASIWPLTLPNTIRKITVKALERRQTDRQAALFESLEKSFN
ncbi:MAG: hypothetical protein ACFBSG_14915 [Leptolyngbyaceae cyanobacterium]